MKKVANGILTEGSVSFKPTMPWGMPTVLQLRPTSRCNLHCRVCPVGMGLDRPTGDMDLPLFQRIIDELGEYLLLIMFWDWGEPFLNPHAYEMIRYARCAGIKVVCSTNGHVLPLAATLARWSNPAWTCWSFRWMASPRRPTSASAPPAASRRSSRASGRW